MIKRATKKTFGAFSLTLGLIFGVFPFVPGILLIIVGLELLGWREAALTRFRSLFGRKKAEVKAVVAPSVTTDTI